MLPFVFEQGFGFERWVQYALDVPIGEVEALCEYCSSRLKFIPEDNELEVVKTREEMKHRERVAVEKEILRKKYEQAEMDRWRETAAKVAIAADAAASSWQIHEVEAVDLQPPGDSTLADLPEGTGLFNSLAVRPDGYPVVAFYARSQKAGDENVRTGDLKLATFDAELAAAMGLAPTIIHYGLMTVVSITAVGAFDAVGLILVVALMIGPAATALLLTDRLGHVLWIAALLGAVSAALGQGLALWLDASIAGCIAVGIGLVFGAVFLLAPGRGLIAVVRRRRSQRWQFAQVMLTIHLSQHEGRPEEPEESRIDHLYGREVGWTPAFTLRVVDLALDAELVTRHGDNLKLTEAGRAEAARALAR